MISFRYNQNVNTQPLRIYSSERDHSLWLRYMNKRHNRRNIQAYGKDKNTLGRGHGPVRFLYHPFAVCATLLRLLDEVKIVSILHYVHVYT